MVEPIEEIGEMDGPGRQDSRMGDEKIWMDLKGLEVYVGK
jgi:hypothetical protein